MDPCIPKNWDGFVVEYRTGMSIFRIEIENPDSINRGVLYVAVDGKQSPEGFIDLTMGGSHHVRVVMGAPCELLREQELKIL